MVSRDRRKEGGIVGVEKLLSGCRGTSKLKDRQVLLLYYGAKFPVLTEMLFYCYEPFKMYNIRPSKSLPAPGRQGAEELWPEFKHLLEDMSVHATPQKNKEILWEILKRCAPATQDLFRGIAAKDLKAGFGVKLINRVFPGLITEFCVQLGNQYDSRKFYPVEMWRGSVKLDGVRCVVLRNEKGKWQKFSRKGKELTHLLRHLDLEPLYQRYGHTFFDGELFAPVGFSKVQGDLFRGRGNYLDYHIVAWGSQEHFLEQRLRGIEIPALSAAEHALLSGESDSLALHVRVLPQYPVKNTSEHVFQAAKRAIGDGFEGLILRDPSKPYGFKRSDAMLKVKIMHDQSVKCIDIVGSYQQRPIEEGGIEEGGIEEVYCLKHLVCKDIKSGKITNVGSGFTFPQRDGYWAERARYVGKHCDIVYQEIGSKGAMRFPVFLRWRFDLSEEE